MYLKIYYILYQYSTVCGTKINLFSSIFTNEYVEHIEIVYVNTLGPH